MAELMDVVRQMQAAVKRQDRVAILALVTPDLEYHYHVGSKPLHGAAKLEKFLDNYWGRMRDVVWQIDKYAQAGSDTLLMEGHEEFTDSQTGERKTNRYMGSMVFRDGKIAVWRDYFQMGPAPTGGPGSQTAASG